MAKQSLLGLLLVAVFAVGLFGATVAVATGHDVKAAETEYGLVALQTTLTSGVPTNGYLSASGDSDYYKVILAGGTAQLRIVTDGPALADFDLYARHAGLPTTSDYDYRGYTSSSDESITITNPESGTWFIMVHSFDGSGSYTITATWPTVIPGFPFGAILLACGVALSLALFRRRQRLQ